jgi:hypothetical protein
MPLFYTTHATCPTYLILLNFITQTILGVIIMQFSPLPCYLVPLRPKYFHQHSK